MKIYLPNTVTSSNCAYVRDKDTIRVYDTQPSYNQTIDYTDYYINSHYLSNRGQSTFSQYSTLPTCLNSNNFTTEEFFRNDFADICIIFTCLCIFVFLIPTKIFMRLFRRVRM